MRPLRRLQNSVLRLLANRLKAKRAYILFQHLGRRFGVEEVVSIGEQGLVQGKLDDEFVYARYLRSGNWSPHLTGFLTHCFDGGEGGTFIDVGTNIGLITLAVARLERVACKSFEPEPENLALLRANLARSGLADRVEVFPIALFSEETTLDFELADGNRGDHRVRTGDSGGGIYDEGGRSVIHVAGRPLDDVLDAATLRRPLVIKCDAQGADLHVWSGGEKAFAAADALVIEYWPYGLDRMDSDPEVLERRLAADFDRGMIVHEGNAIRADAFVPIESVVADLKRFRAEAEVGEHVDVVATKAALAEQLVSATSSASEASFGSQADGDSAARNRDSHNQRRGG